MKIKIEWFPFVFGLVNLLASYLVIYYKPLNKIIWAAPLFGIIFFIGINEGLIICIEKTKDNLK